MSKINQALQAQLKRIEICKSRIVALMYAVEGTRDKFSRKQEQEFSSLTAALFSNLNEAYRSYFMFANIEGGDAQKEAKKAAYRHYLKTGSSIMDYLTFDGNVPSQWWAEDEENFRKEIEEKVNE